VTASGDFFGLLGATLAEKYRVDRVLGEGGFGVVYAGFHLLLGQPIAIKCMKPAAGTLTDQQRVTELFLREARVLFALTHPNIVRLYDVGTFAMPSAMSGPVPQVPYVVLELIPGRSLQDEIQARHAQGGTHFSLAEISSLFRQVLDGVAFAHEHGVVHRDLKPSNVMLVGQGPSWTIKVVDFGIARVAASAETTTGAPFTPLYAAPEQWDPTLGSVTATTDVFAVGLMLVEVCALTKALPSESLGQVMSAALDPSKRRTIASVRRDLPANLDDVAAWATRVRPQERAPSARALQQGLLSTLGAGTSHGTQPIPMVPSTPASYVAPPPATSPPGYPTVAMTHETALSQTPPPQSTTQPSPRRGSSTGKIILAVTAILSVTILIGITIVMGFAYKACTDQPWMQPPSPVAENPTQQTQPPSEVRPKPIPPTNGWVFLSSVQPGHFFTEHQIRNAVDPAVADFESCYEKHVPMSERFDSLVLLTLMPTTQGAIAQVSCDVMVNRKRRPDDELSSCLSSKAAALTLPRPTGKLGLLRTGPVLVQLGTRKTQKKK
jgi:serine/threonine-protein kinase